MHERALHNCRKPCSRDSCISAQHCTARDVCGTKRFRRAATQQMLLRLMPRVSLPDSDRLLPHQRKQNHSKPSQDITRCLCRACLQAPSWCCFPCTRNQTSKSIEELSTGLPRTQLHLLRVDQLLELTRKSAKAVRAGLCQGLTDLAIQITTGQ